MKRVMRKTYAEAILDHFNSVRFLTALRASALGVEELNHEIALALRAEKLLWFRQRRRLVYWQANYDYRK